MITLHGFAKNFGLVDPSSLVLKVDAYLRMADIPFNRNTDANNLNIAPKGKLPFINDTGKIIADSQFIFEHLKENYVDLDENLNKQEKAQAYLVTKSLDENLYFCLVYSRWICDDTWPLVKQAFFGHLPIVLRSLIPALVRKKVKRNLIGQGLSKHSHKEILHISKQSFQALSDLLADNDYFFGNSPSSLDAAAYGALVSFVQTTIQNPFNDLAQTFPNLLRYCQRITEKYYGEV